MSCLQPLQLMWLEVRMVQELIVAAPHDRLEVDDVGLSNGRGVHERRGPATNYHFQNDVLLFVKHEWF